MLRIVPLKARHIPAAKKLIVEVLHEIVLPDMPLQELAKGFEQSGELNDVETAATHYFARRGCFLVLLDEERVVGTAAVRRLDETTCELKRMWLLREFRGQGWGRRLAEELIVWAREAGYTRIRLDSGDPTKQAAAIGLYRKLGFAEIPRYNDNSYARIWMEKQL